MTDLLIANGDLHHTDARGRRHVFTDGDAVPAGVFTADELQGLRARGAIATHDERLQPLRDEITALRDELAERELHLANLEAALTELEAR